MSDTTTNVWCLVIDHEYKPIGSAIKVTVPLTLNVANLKTKITEEKQNALAHVGAHMLTVFECTDSSIDLVDDDDNGSDEGMVPNKVKKVFSSKMVKKLRVDRTIASLQLQNDTLIVQVPDILQKVRKCDDDDGSDDNPPEIKLLKEEIGDRGPSSLTDPVDFRKITGPGHVIDFNCPFTSDMLPIELYDEAFGVFKMRAGKPPSTNALTFLNELAPVGCNWYTSVADRREEVQRVFEEYTHLQFHSEQVPGTNHMTDGNLDRVVMPATIHKCKNESSRGDAVNQIIVFYAKFLLNALYHPLCYRNSNTRFPCILMVDQGPYFGFYGAVWDGRIRVEALTMFNLATHHLDENGRFAIASTLDAFKDAVDKIQARYTTIQVEATAKAGTSRATEYDHRLAKSRKYPYLTSFEINGEELALTYRSRLLDQSLLFFVTGNKPDSGQYFIKYTRRYSVEAHQWLASRDLAPRLWQHKETPSGWIVIAMEFSRYSMYSGLHLSRGEQEKVCSKVTMVLKEFHDQGFVHGDIRGLNLLVDCDSLASNDAKDVRIHLVDFDWAGKAGEAKYPIGINTETVKRPDGVGGGVLITREHDEIMVRYMFP